MTFSNHLRLTAAPTAAFLALATLALDARSATNESFTAVEAAPAGVSSLQAISVGPLEARVYLDRPGDGALWARGRRWKASFDDSGATYYAGFGARQPRSLPHALSPDSVTIGGEPLDFARVSTPEVFGERVELDRGAFVEAYELDVDSIEQLFVFDSLPRGGDLVVTIPVASELDGVETDAGLEFRGELGRVTYSRAIAIDADGKRVSAPTRFVDGAIQITVDAQFLATAAFPLVIDPVVGQIVLDTTVDDTFAPDIAWDPFHQVWLAVYAETFSATDIDVFARLTNAAGLTISTAYVDASTASWTRPRVANNGAAHKFLVVAERTSSTPKAVMGRMVVPNGTILTVDPQFDIGGSAAGDKMTPDVGGDPSTSGSTRFCVVFEHTLGGGDSEIGFRQVTSNSALIGAAPTYFADATVERNYAPSVSRSKGSTSWGIAWLHEISFPFGVGVFVASVDGGGTTTTTPFALPTVLNTIVATPCVSSPLTGSVRYAVVYSSRSIFPLGSPADVIVTAVDGGTILQTVNLMTLENSGQQAQNQVEPSVDSDGQHFLVAYSERNATFGHYECFVSDIYLAGNQLGLSQSHVIVHPGLGLSQRVSQIAAKPALSGTSHRYAVIYEIRQNDQNHDVVAKLFDGFEGGTTGSFCPGDGTLVACPCGNDSVQGRGCSNSVNSDGALLAASGTASTVNDTLRLQASALPPSSTCLFFQGTVQNSPNVFGDGLLCTAGTVVRLATKTVMLGAVQYPAPGSSDPSISVRGAVPLNGGQRYYQVWYRNAAAFCTSATFNLTNGVSVSWAR